jgi:hypothetical protein
MKGGTSAADRSTAFSYRNCFDVQAPTHGRRACVLADLHLN